MSFFPTKTPYTISFAMKPPNQVRRLVKSLGLIWKNDEYTEFTGLVSISDIEELEVLALFNSRRLSDSSAFYYPVSITRHLYDPIVIYFGKQPPKKGPMKEYLISLNFKWWNKDSAFGVSYPNSSIEKISVEVKKLTDISFHIKKVRSLRDLWELFLRNENLRNSSESEEATLYQFLRDLAGRMPETKREDELLQYWKRLQAERGMSEMKKGDDPLAYFMRPQEGQKGYEMKREKDDLLAYLMRLQEGQKGYEMKREKDDLPQYMRLLQAGQGMSEMKKGDDQLAYLMRLQAGQGMSEMKKGDDQLAYLMRLQEGQKGYEMKREKDDLAQYIRLIQAGQGMSEMKKDDDLLASLMRPQDEQKGYEMKREKDDLAQSWKSLQTEREMLERKEDILRLQMRSLQGEPETLEVKDNNQPQISKNLGEEQKEQDLKKEDQNQSINQAQKEQKTHETAKKEGGGEEEDISPKSNNLSFQVSFTKNNHDEMQVSSMEQRPCIFSDLFEDKTERELYDIAQSIPDGMDMKFSIDNDVEDEAKMKRIYINVTRWDAYYQKKIRSTLLKMDALHIVTSTPETVFPWILQFPNLRILEIQAPDEETDLEKENISSQSNSKKIKLDMNQINEIATFKDALEVRFSDEVYDESEDLRCYLTRIFKQFKEKSKLKQLIISQNFESLKGKIAKECQN